MFELLINNCIEVTTLGKTAPRTLDHAHSHYFKSLRLASLKFLIFTTEITEELVNVVPRTWRGGGNFMGGAINIIVQFEAKARKNELQHYESFLDLGL